MLSFPTVVNQTIPLKFHTLQLGVSCYDAPAPQQLNEWITSSGFASCTETLGSESSDDRSTSSSDEISSFNTSSDEENEIHFPDHMVSSQQIDDNNNNNNVTGERFPPPLPSLNRLDQTSFILRHVRKDGRLELTEIKGNRPEILCATRHNGRLTIRVVKDLGKHDDNIDDYDQEVGKNNKEVKVLDHIHDDDIDEKGVVWSTTTSLVSQGERVKRRCYEYQVINITTGVAHHHHRHRHCVTTG